MTSITQFPITTKQIIELAGDIPALTDLLVLQHVGGGVSFKLSLADLKALLCGDVWGVLNAVTVSPNSFCSGWAIVRPMSIPTDLAGSYCPVYAAATGTEVYDIKKTVSGVTTTIGTISITATTATLTCTTQSLAAGDSLSIWSQAAATYTAIFSLSILGTLT